MSLILVPPTVATGNMKFTFPLIESQFKPVGRSGVVSRQKGWVHKNLEEKQPLGGEEMPIDAWKELQKVVRH